MNCARYRHLISLYIDDEVTSRQRRELLAHVGQCHDCAAWLARARQAEVMLKSVGETHPSDNVRNAIFSQLRNAKPSVTEAPPRKAAPERPKCTPLGMILSALLLRFDPSPRRVVLGFGGLLLVALGALYWLNLLPPLWSNKLGFEVPPDQAGASVNATPIPIEAISSGLYGSGVSAPSVVHALPGAGVQAADLRAPIVLRFDQPMDRGSVEDALLITPPSAGTVQWAADNELRWLPSERGLLRGITYTVSLSGTALSLAGVPVRGPLVWSFHTLEPYAVTSTSAVEGQPGGASAGPLGAFTLHFDTPMLAGEAERAVSLATAGGDALPLSFTWSKDAATLTLTPLRPMPLGYVVLSVRADARTQGGTTLGRAYEFRYRVEAPQAYVRLLDGRMARHQAGAPVRVEFAAVGPERAVRLDLYRFPAEMLSALGAQASVWPQPLPANLASGLELVATQSGGDGITYLPALPSGFYLLVANVTSGGSPGTGDWQLVLMDDGSISAVEGGSLLWATSGGHAWEGAEVSFYSAQGALLGKGLTERNGILPVGEYGQQATLVVARDTAGHMASLPLQPAGAQGTPPGSESNLPVWLVTDREEYRPGGALAFRLYAPFAAIGNQPRLADEGSEKIEAHLLTPQGASVEALSLRLDQQGGASGLFSLARNAEPGFYRVRVSWGASVRDFPVRVVSARADSLSVALLPAEADYVTPDNAAQTGTEIRRVVSVLGRGGTPAAGALLTATLRIKGDGWVSAPVTATTDARGITTLRTALPSWAEAYNEAGLYWHVEAASDGLSGASDLYLDLATQRSVGLGITQLVSPGMNVSVAARPVAPRPPDNQSAFKVRAVLLDPTLPSGDLLLLAAAPSGERISYAINLASMPGGDATITLPGHFAGGTVSIYMPGAERMRTLRLMPAGDDLLDLHLSAPAQVGAGELVEARIEASISDGAAVPGRASLVWRRVSGGTGSEMLPVSWSPSVELSATGVVTAGLAAPAEPGMWYLMAEASTESGSSLRGWAVVDVLPSTWVQVAPFSSFEAGTPATLGIRVHNPQSNIVSTALRASGEGVSLVGGGERTITIPALGWLDQGWVISSALPGEKTLAFAAGDSPQGAVAYPAALAFRPDPRLDASYTAGTLTGERNVGVAVPWNIDSNRLKLEIRASTSLLSALAATARDLGADWVSPSRGVEQVAAMLSASPPVASAYLRAFEPAPTALLPAHVERSALLQQLYAAQREDGSWSYSLAGDGSGSLEQTALVLVALHRASSYSYADGQLNPDERLVGRALDFLHAELARPLRADASTALLDERAFALYALSLYRTPVAEMVRPMLAFAAGGTSGANGLSDDGQGWLALALWTAGLKEDGAALLDTSLRAKTGGSAPRSASFLAALLHLTSEQPQPGVYSPARNPQLAARIAEALMSARQGAGWGTPRATSDALWALALYAAQYGEEPSADPPAVLLESRPIPPAGYNDIPGQISVLVTGDQLRAGTNWLKLRSPDTGRPLYYSFTLTATR